MPSGRSYVPLKKKPRLLARSNRDVPLDAEDKARKFYTLEGRCSKCGMGDHTLIIYDVVPNRKVLRESLFRICCLFCGHKESVFSKEIDTLADEEPPEDPPPTEPA